MLTVSRVIINVQMIVLLTIFVETDTFFFHFLMNRKFKNSIYLKHSILVTVTKLIDTGRRRREPANI